MGEHFIGNFSFSNAAFPLTPALSLRERETHTPPLEYTWRGRFANALTTILPLSKGEGQGEGERDVQTSRALYLSHEPRLQITPAPLR
jgi:hypothetical protein